MRTPQRQKTKLARAQTSVVQTYPAPIGGWNARDAWAQMKPTDAITLDNWFPRASYVEMRGGYASHATAMTGNGKTLATYNALNGTNSMFAFTASGTYDVSAAGAVGASVLARTDGAHQWTNFGDGTNNYLIACNGVDKPAYFDGSTWIAVDNATSPALSGVTSSNLVSVNTFKGRLFFIEVNSLSFWYLASGAAGGALTEFPLDAECARGGYLMAMATWTVDSGAGPDDRAAFITSEGEAIIYEGTNPSSFAAWTKVGAYFLGKPLGRRCFCQFGGDIVVITENGAFPLSQAIQSVNIDFKLALSNKIERAFTDAAGTYGSSFGWQTIVFPAQSALIVNIPLTVNGAHDQYVMNTITKAWCRFTGWAAENFVIYNKELYGVSGSVVYKFWTGFSDAGANIVGYGKTAFSYFGRSGLLKRFTLFRPTLSVNGSVSYLTDIDVDFGDTTLVGNAVYTPTVSATWGTSLWGVGLWGSGQTIIQSWTSPAENPGFCAAGKLKIASNTFTIRWMTCDYVYEYGVTVG